jgi:hypothetical protein
MNQSSPVNFNNSGALCQRVSMEKQTGAVKRLIAFVFCTIARLASTKRSALIDHAYALGISFILEYFSHF